MKRIGNLWPEMISFEGLLRAHLEARRGKRFRPSVLSFEFNLEYELWRLHHQLAKKVYQPGGYRSFWIYEPKARLISAAPYRDRVVHHALTGALEPIFERSFTFDSYACRKGRGTHAAVRRAQDHARRFRYVLKADVRKFFPSVDHEVLKGLLARKIKDRGVLWLAAQIIDRSNAQEAVLEWFPGDDLFVPSERRRGVPIGNQTSQFLANVYLDPLDHFLTDRVRAGGYVRYVDDFLVFSNDKRELSAVRDAARKFLGGLRLRLHHDKSVIFPTSQGIRFLGYRVFPTHRLLANENVRRFRRRMARLQAGFARGSTSAPEIRQRMMSWSGHARQASTYRLRERLFATIGFQRATAESACAAGGRVQQ